MHFTRIAAAVSLGLGAALLAAPALAGPVSPLIEGNFIIESSDDIGHNLCSLTVYGSAFNAHGDIQGEGTGGEPVAVVLNTMQPTSVTRSTDKLSVKQSQFAALSADFNGAIVVSNVPIEKCSVSGSFTKHNGHGAVSVRCKGDDLSALLSADQITSLRTAMQRKHVKFTVDQANAKWSLSTDCKGTWFP
jgi:hypothetical protein